MKIEYKSLFLGLILGIIGLFSVLYLLGNVETEFYFTTGDKKQNKDIDIRVEQTIENGEDITNVVIIGKGDVSREELEQELERMLEKNGIDRDKTKLKVEMEIQS
tara:strand:- start:505 stop:819 length:315 start_codon:yes stop_codon:yes gene_type:complete